MIECMDERQPAGGCGMNRLVIVRGLPGSGKSTLAKKLAAAFDMIHVEADMYFGDSYSFDARKLPVAHAWCQREVQSILESGKKAIVSNTFSRVWEMMPYVSMVDPTDLTIIRCEGEYGNVHNVPEATILRMKSRWEDYPIISCAEATE